MRLVAIGGVHRNTKDLLDIIQIEKTLAAQENKKIYFLSAGDMELPDELIQANFDFFVDDKTQYCTSFENQKIVTLQSDSQKIKLILTYGNNLVEDQSDLLINSKLEKVLHKLAQKESHPLENLCVVFGWTHFPTFVEFPNNCYVTNPGSAFEPRFGSIPSYLVLDFQNGKVTNFKFKNTSVMDHYYDMHMTHIPKIVK
ncbi:metallophosphoesterase family protein [Mycoplasmopsis columbinasalis]|uniref:Calcineurin-like phosphoesterase superfamily domain n=1 Tax=Mycoplasmopsis columbinasalis TaxID=114880 RepID=A0A449BAJ0_9BACT|nr:metallophosphoesterase family protein [Mycoplasmopsis columbinasalis]VEU78206.1 Calcineurin-like phosphoesterase superfamily domain [Mycoplasmopsis columbinasalis]